MDECARKRQNKNKSGRKKGGLLVGYLRDYLSNSYFHGLRYIGEPSISLVERIFWAVMFTLSTVACSLLIMNVWRKWEQSPVIVSFSERTTPVWQIPFPAVTICTKNRIQSSKYNFTKVENLDNFLTWTQKELDKYDDIIILCEESNYVFGYTRNYGNISIMNNILSAATDMNKVVTFCNWRSNGFECYEQFSRTITNNGQCFTFNSLSSEEMFRTENIQQEYNYSEEMRPSSDWSLEKGYLSNSLDVYPRRGRNFGAKPDLVALLEEDQSDLNPQCNGATRGFEVLLHHPSDKPILSQYYIEVRPGEEKKIAIKVNIETISESLKNYDPLIRQCYFHNERYLRYFKMYTQKNCELECRSNYTFAMCGCVSYYMPHNDSNHICAQGAGIDCVDKANDALADSFVGEGSDEIAKDKYNGADKETVLRRIARSCQCLPACDSISYEADTSGSNIDFQTYNKLSASEDEIREYENISLSRISLFFKNAQFISTRRSELYGQTDFLANCGGLLGLFLGFSVLSLVEIIYYMTLRLVCKIRKSHTLKSIEEHQKEI